ncbi:MAG: hypothetical protein Q8P41_00085 [Pseudomonadota bacterium]|nr:hypothetical protein [Pseudomonadota bacterium]
MATLEQVFQRERTWIAACGDVDALMAKISDWRDDLRAAERDGNMLVRMRAGDLVGLAQGRIVRLQAGEIRAENARAAPAKEVVPKVGERRAEPRIAEPARASQPQARRREPENGPARHTAHEVAARAAAEKVKADARIAAAEAAKIELQNELLRAQVVAAKRAAAAPAAAKAPTLERAVLPKPVAATANPAPKTASPPKTATAQSQPAPSHSRAPGSKPATVWLNDTDGYTVHPRPHPFGQQFLDFSRLTPASVVATRGRPGRAARRARHAG